MRRLCHLMVGLLLACACGRAQRYPMLPVPNSPHGVFMMWQDSHSRLWLGTIDDVYCFDGENFYSLRPYGFPHETTNAFGEDSEGGIWIGTQGTDLAGGTKHGGLYRYQAGRVAKILDGDALDVAGVAPGVVIASMGAEASGRPAFGDLYRLTRERGAWKAEKLLEKVANHMTLDHQGNILFPCPGGWCEIAPQQVADWKGASAVTRHQGDPLTERVVRDRYGCIWQRAEIRANYQCPDDPKPVYLSDTISQIDNSAHLQEGPDGSMFMLVALTLGRPGAFQHTGAMGELPPGGLNSAMIAADGTIWIGTDYGLFRFMYPFRLELWPQEGNVPGMGVFIEHVNDTVYTASSAWGLSRLNADRHHWSGVPGAHPLGLGQDVALIGKGLLLEAATDSSGVVRADGSLLTRSPKGDAGIRLVTTSDGQIWMGGGAGIQRVALEGSHLHFEPEPVPRDLVQDMQYDRERDILWACDGKRLMFRKDGVWGALSARDGLLDQGCSAIAPEANGDVWMGYRTPAYARIENPTTGHPVVHNFTQDVDTVVANSAVFALTADRRGWLWKATNLLAVGTPANVQAGSWLRLDQSEGVAPMADEGRPLLSDTDGSVWFVTDDGIMHFTPPPGFATDFTPPPVFIAGFSAGGRAPQLMDTVQALPRNTTITAHIGSLQFDRRNALHFRYRLLPEQKAWTSTSEFHLNLHTPRWGRHTLEMQEQMLNGAWSTTQAATFTVLRPLWLTWPFLAGFAGVGGLAGLGGHRWRQKRRSQMQKAFPDLGAWRLAALLPELHQLAGTLLDGRFTVGQVLARGGFATVVEGEDMQQGGLPCAIKVFRQELVDKEWMARRFRHEVLALATIHHPNVVRIYGHGITPGGSQYLAMEFVDGRTLRSMLDDGQLGCARTALYLRQIGSALDALHARGVCHRDLKPENLMIRSVSPPGMELVLIDFSIAIVKDPDETLHGLSRAAGTIYYMAPEQAIGYADASTDIYSLAKIVIEMLTGQRLSYLLPDASMDLPARVRELLSQLPITLSSPSIELLSSALEFDPSRRPRIAGAFSDCIAVDLESVPAGPGLGG